MNSREQQLSINHRRGLSFWGRIDLPDLKLPPVPPWLEDLSIDWMVGFSSPPTTRVWSTMQPLRDLLDPERAQWEYDCGLYLAISSDGRRMAYAHSAPQLIDGEWATERADGYGGRTFNIRMTDGRRVALRGPWYTTPPGCEPVTLIEPRSLRDLNGNFAPEAKPPDWSTRGGTFGLFLTHSTFIAAVHHFHPELLFSDTTLSSVRFIEPYRKEWNRPKSAMTSLERAQWNL